VTSFPRVLVTRPAAQAAEWVRLLQGHGLEATALPLIGIEPPADAAAVVAAWSQLASLQCVVFVSPNAAEQFFALRPAGAVWPDALQAASPGPGTTETLRRLGVPAERITAPADDAPQFDSESLWLPLALRNWQGAQVLVVRGEAGRDWLADRFRQQGASVRFLTGYRRVAPRLDSPAVAVLEAALRAPQSHLWFFSSSEAVGHLVRLRTGALWSESRAVATHPRIAQAARSAGFGQVRTCRPEPSSVVACIQSPAW
jgi:uroporphyrinogen-III synthase